VSLKITQAYTHKCVGGQKGEGAWRKCGQWNQKHNFSFSLLYPTVPCSQVTIPSNYCVVVGRDSLVGIATCYVLNGPGSIPVEARFSAPVRTGPGAYPSSYIRGTGYFKGVKG